MCEFKDYLGLELTPKHRNIVRDELDWWHKAYIPENGIKGNVLDLGAGCGETAFFYLAHGADFVTCFEYDPAALVCLYANFRRDPRVLIIPQRVDRVKVDIEGSEEGMFLEVHFPFTLKKWPREGVGRYPGETALRIDRPANR